MPSIQSQYNHEVLQAHREAIAALRQLLAEEKNPLERRRLAMALLKARPVKPLAVDEAALSEPEASAREAGGLATASSALSEPVWVESARPAGSPATAEPSGSDATDPCPTDTEPNYVVAHTLQATGTPHAPTSSIELPRHCLSSD
jgi:HEAT repeat protein